MSTRHCIMELGCVGTDWATVPSNSPILFSSVYFICFSPVKWGYMCREPPVISHRISWDQTPPWSVAKAIPMANSWGWS